jgi:hypothetical protein
MSVKPNIIPFPSGKGDRIVGSNRFPSAEGNQTRLERTTEKINRWFQSSARMSKLERDT